MEIKRNDRRPPYVYKLGIDITGCEVRFIMAAKNKAIKIDGLCEMLDAPTGKVCYSWAEGDTDTAGAFDCEFQVTFPNGMRETFPLKGFLGCTITPDLKPPHAQTLNPLDAPGLTHMFDASVNVTEMSNLVSAWGPMVQSSDAHKPTFVEGGLNTAPVLRFGGMQWLSGARRVQASGLTHWAVVRLTSVDATASIGDLPITLLSDPAGGAYNSLGFAQGKLAYMAYVGSYITVTAPATLNDGAPHTVAVTHGLDGVIKLYVDGALVQTGTAAPYDTVHYAWSEIGAGYQNADPFEGDLAAIAMYDGVLTADSIMKMHRFAVETWF